MHSAARRRLLLGAISSLTAGGFLRAAEAAARAAPTRPGNASTPAAPPTGTATKPATPAPAVPAPAGRKIGRIDYIAVPDAARHLGLKLRWLAPGRKFSLTGSSATATLEADTRDIVVNGLRVFLGEPVAGAGGQLHVSRVDLECCLTPMLRPGHGVAARPAPRIVVLDAGHGGTDPGKTNAQLGIKEKTLTLDVAMRARKLLAAAGYRVVLTRENDTFVALPQRAALANIAKGDLMVSIHFNALANDTRTSGVEVYTFAPRLQRSTNAWGVLEQNDTEDFASPGNRFDHWNVVLAHAIHRRFVVDLKTPDRGKKLMHLAVLRGLQCPGMLIECGFLTSDTEARKIATAAYRQQIAGAIAGGIRDYAAALGRLRPAAAAR